MSHKLDLGGVGSGGEWTTVNTDTSGYRAAPDIVANITASAMELEAHIEAASVDAVRCIHTLEHLPQWDIIPTLAYWRTFLKPGGDLFIVVPDMAQILEDYCNAVIPFDVVIALAYVSGFRTVQGPQEEHRWGFGLQMLTDYLRRAGYREVMEWVEYPAFWLFDFPDMAHTNCVGRYNVPNLRLRAKA